MSPDQRLAIRQHRRGIPIRDICDDLGVTHTVLYRILATVDPEDRYPRIIPWTADEERVLILNQDATARDLTAALPRRTVQAIKWRRRILRQRGELPPV